MVGVVDTVYLAAVVAVAIVGIGFLARLVASDSTNETSRWFEWASFGVVAVFLLAMAVELLG